MKLGVHREVRLGGVGVQGAQIEVVGDPSTIQIRHVRRFDERCELTHLAGQDRGPRSGELGNVTGDLPEPFADDTAVESLGEDDVG